jgi:purine-binding chemotaxis protein CheW
MSMSDRKPLGSPPVSALTRSHLLTRVDRFDLAFPIEDVISVHAAPNVTSIPSARTGILGGVRIHGAPVPVADIRRCLRLSRRNVMLTDRLVLLRVDGRPMAVIVDEVKNLIDVPTNALGGPDALFEDTPVNTRVIAGIAATPDLCAIVDVEGFSVPDPWDDEDAFQSLEVELDDDAPLAERTAALAAPPEAEAAAGTEAAVFLLDGQRYAVPVTSILEFFRDLPHAPLMVRGVSASLVNRRGDAIALYDMRPLLGLSATKLPAQVNGIVLSHGGVRVAMAVDELAGLETLPLTASTASQPGRFTMSVHPGPNGTVQLIDVAALLAAPQLTIGNEVAT